MALPKFIYVKSNINNKYLCYTKEEGPYHARLQFSLDEKDEKPEFRCIKFEVEESTIEGMVHIRNGYNNKYLVRKSADSNLIVGEANEPEEDQSKWSCTLFKPVFLDSAEEDVESAPHLPDKPRKIRLLHIDQLGQQFTSMHNTEEPSDLVVGDKDARSSEVDSDVFTVYDARSAVILPDHIALIGSNNQYCNVTFLQSFNFLCFNTGDIGAPGVLNTTTHTLNSLFIKNAQTGNYWRVTGGGLLNPHWPASSIGTPVAGKSGLRPIRLGGNEIAIFCEEIDQFAYVHHEVLGVKDVLLALSTSIIETAKFKVVEPVLLREVKNLKYNTEDARLYNVSQVSMYTDSRANYGSIEESGSFSVSYTKAQTMSWNDSVSVSTGLSASMSLTIPYVGELGFEYSREETQTREWGKETTKEEKVEYVQNVTILPRTRKIITVVAMEASYDIPFTCEVIDTLTNGQVIRYTKTDGLFVGSNGYKYETEIHDEDL